MRVVLVLFALISAAFAVNRVIVKGNKFFDSVTGQQFFVNGVDYQPSTDPLADLTSLNRDIQQLTALGVNTIRVYQTAVTGDAANNAMSALDAAGMYLILDASNPDASIDTSTATSAHWDLRLYNAFTTKITPFLSKNNLLAVLAGNEVINNVTGTYAAPFVKASIRDVKAYIASQGYTIPVGYAATDYPNNTDFAFYLNCGSRALSADFFGLNVYRWCGNVSYSQSGYPAILNDYGAYTAPFIFTEYGCNNPRPRFFLEVSNGIFSSQFNNFLSGGLVYQYSQDVNDYGLVNITSTGDIIRNQDFTDLVAQIQNITYIRTNLTSQADTTATVNNCPAQGTNFLANPSASLLPPTPNATVCDCMYATLLCHANTTDITLATQYSTAIASSTNVACSNVGTGCNPINSNGNTGVYGMYSGCNALQRASYAMNAYYLRNRANGATSCSFGGFGKLESSVATPSATCQAIFAATVATSTTSTFSTSPNANAGTTTVTTSSVTPVVGTTTTTTQTPAAGAAAGLVPAAAVVAAVALLAL